MSIETKIKRSSKICAFWRLYTWLCSCQISIWCVYSYYLWPCTFPPPATPLFMQRLLYQRLPIIYGIFVILIDGKALHLPIIWCIDQLHRPLDKKMPHRFRALPTNSTISVYSYLNPTWFTFIKNFLIAPKSAVTGVKYKCRKIAPNPDLRCSGPRKPLSKYVFRTHSLTTLEHNTSALTIILQL